MAMTEMVEGLPDLPTPSEIDDGVLRVFDELDEPERVDLEGGAGGYRITDAGSADWACRKLTAVRERKTEADELAKRQIDAIMAMVEPYLAPIREWHESLVSKLDGEAGFWEGMLELYHRDVVLAEDPNAKSVKLPHGTLKSRKAPDKWDIAEEDFMAWARDVAPEFIRRIEEVDKALVKKTLKVGQFGQAILDLPEGQLAAAGVEVTVGERSFSVETEVQS